jgi:hypothetical protein
MHFNPELMKILIYISILLFRKENRSSFNFFKEGLIRGNKEIGSKKQELFNARDDDTE